MSFAEALAPLSRRMPRVVREHEVLRVAGWMRGDDSKTVARTAIAEVLKWAQKRCGGQLPPDAWAHKSFDYLSGGRNSRCVRIESSHSDLWVIRADDPDKNVAERVWTTEVVVGLLPDRPARFSTRLLVSTPEADLQIEPHTPGLVRQITDTCTLMSGQQRLSADPLVFETQEDSEYLIDHLLNTDRLLPTFVLTVEDDANSKRPRIDANELSRAILGMGHVAIAHLEPTWEMTRQFGKARSVFGGAVRVYFPGFSEDANPYGHRLVLADQLDTPKNAARVTRWIRQLAAKESVRCAKLGRDVLTFSAIRNVNLRLRQQALKNQDASESDQLVAANDRIAALEKEIESLGSEQDYYISEFENERNRAEVAEAQAQKSAYRIQLLTDQLKSRGDDPDQDVGMPSSWGDFADWCDRNLAGRLVLTPHASRNTRKPLYEDIETAARCLLWLASARKDQRINGGSRNTNIEGIKNTPCGADTYDFDWNGRKLSADWHIKSGGNTRDPTRCLRIYYCFDPQTQQIIVSDMPAHRRTAAS